MKKNMQQVFAVFLVGMVMMSLGTATLAEAGLTAQEMSGTVEVAMTDELLWQTLTREMSLQAGNHIRTAKDSSVGLKGEDGSVLYLGENTQIAIAELVYSEAQQTRVCRFKMLFGILTTEASTLAYKTNVFEVETDTVVAGIKSSSMTLMAKHTKAQGDKPYTKILPLKGKFEMRQIGEGITDVECFLEDAQGGIEFSLDLNTVVDLKVEQTPGNEKIAVKSGIPLQNMRALLSREHNMLCVKNFVEAPEILVGFQEYGTRVGPDSIVRFGLPFAQADQEFFISDPNGINAEFSFGRKPGIPDGNFCIFADKGTIEVNGEKLSPGAPGSCFPIGVLGIGIPPAPVSRPPKPIGSPILP